MTIVLLSPAEALGHVPAELRASDAALSPVARLVGRRCCCGDLVWADLAAPGPGVSAHYASKVHAAWWSAVESLWTAGDPGGD